MLPAAIGGRVLFATHLWHNQNNAIDVSLRRGHMVASFVVGLLVAGAAAQAQSFLDVRDKLNLYRATLLSSAYQARPSPRIVCGMVLVPIDPNYDSRIRMVAPSTPDHKIKAVRPPVCVD